ncbi:hypothetical protein ACS0TY_005260 [Phlomoides rotata]
MRAKQMPATMSHEIRSPLSGVVSMAEIISTTKLEKEQKQLLKVMLSSADKRHPRSFQGGVSFN